MDQSLQSEPRAGPFSPKWTPRCTILSKVNPTLDQYLQSEPRAGPFSPKWTPRWTNISKVNPALELSILGCSSSQQHTACFIENNLAPYLLLVCRYKYTWNESIIRTQKVKLKHNNKHYNMIETLLILEFNHTLF